MKRIKNLILVFFSIIICSCAKPKPKEQNGMILLEGTGDVKSFWIDKSPITVAQFEKFVEATNFKTQAETFGDAGVFDFETGSWTLLKGANWRFPQGPDNKPAELNHPVTQVSWNDAVAYCKWAGKRLPTSAEFVFAEKRGEEDYSKTYAWGESFIENGQYKANFWQGSFPYKNTVEDGFLTTSPVGHFGQNEIGLVDIGGNVWQWCEDFSADKPEEKSQRGGSYLCDPSVCHGFKVNGQSSSTPETSLMHVGFRTVKSDEK